MFINPLLCAMRSFSTLLIFLFIIIVTTSARNYLRLPDTRAAGLGGNEVTQSVRFNPSLISLYEKNSISFDYYNAYGIKELGAFSVMGMFPSAFLSAGIYVSSFGYEEYRQNLIRAVAGKQLNEYWTLGAAVQYSFLHTVLFEEKPGLLSADMGVTWSPVENLLAGLLIMNLPSFALKDKVTDINYFTDYKIQVGFEWLFINDLLILFTLEHNEEQSFTGSAGIEYFLGEQLRLRAGVQARSLIPSVGIGYKFRSFTADVAILYHSVLGISTGIGLTYSF